MNESTAVKESVIPPHFTVAWQFIVGMLTNFGTVDTARMYETLTAILPGGGPIGQPELEAFMSKMAEEEKVEAVSGGWRLKK